MNEIKAVVIPAAFAVLGSRVVGGFTAGKGSLWELVGAVAGAAVGLWAHKKIL